MKASTKIKCQYCGKMVRTRYLKEAQLPPEITLLGFSVCPTCESPAIHVKGDPDAVEAVMEDFQAAMGDGDFDLTLTDVRSGKHMADG